jgi:hypothetical protein
LALLLGKYGVPDPLLKFKASRRRLSAMIVQSIDGVKRQGASQILILSARWVVVRELVRRFDEDIGIQSVC